MDNDVDYLIAFSVNDVAGRGIASSIIEMAKCSSMDYKSIEGLEAKSAYLCSNLKSMIIGFDEDVVFFDFIEGVKKVKYFIILSRHTSLTGMPTLTTHVPGNPWGRNDVGGRPWEIPPANPVLMWYFLKGLNQQKILYSLSEFKVSYEVTHHGPTSITRPITFIEIGSTEREWGIIDAHRAVASVVIDGIKRSLDQRQGLEQCVVSVGFGGPHYAPLFTRRAMEYSECYGHIIPSYVIKELDLDEVRSVAIKAIEYTPGVRRIVIEKMRGEVKRIISSIAETKGLEIIVY